MNIKRVALSPWLARRLITEEEVVKPRDACHGFVKQRIHPGSLLAQLLEQAGWRCGHRF